jgi:hypothetical protein
MKLSWSWCRCRSTQRWVPGHTTDVEDPRVAVLADLFVPKPLVCAVLRVQRPRFHKWYTWTYCTMYGHTKVHVHVCTMVHMLW